MPADCHRIMGNYVLSLRQRAYQNQSRPICRSHQQAPWKREISSERGYTPTNSEAATRFAVIGATQRTMAQIRESSARNTPLVIPDGHKLIHVMRHARAW